MCTDSLTYLRDEASAERISVWSRRLAESAEEALSHLSRMTDEGDPTALEQTYGTLESEIQALVRECCGIIRRYSAQIPLPKGFFVSAEQRLLAYRAVCRMLGVTEPLLNRMRLLSLRLSRLRETLATEELGVARAWEELLLARRAAKEMDSPALWERIGQLEAVATENRERRNALGARLVLLQERSGQTVTDLIPQFLLQIGQDADMEHDGAGCNPVSISRLCAELCYALENR